LAAILSFATAAVRAEPATLAAESQQARRGQVAAVQPEEAVGQDAALQETSNSSLMNRGSSDPVLASVWAMKSAECDCA